jgi:beta-mannosidase
MQGYPDIRTVEEWDDDKTQLFPQSRTSVNHNKAVSCILRISRTDLQDGFERRLELYLMENFRHAFDMESYIYYTQAMQAECLAAAYRLWRREWRGRGKESTAGALVWQVSEE